MLPPTMAARTDSPSWTAELVRDPDGLKDLEEVWSALALGRENVFLTPEWFAVWRRHYGGAATPLVGAVRSAAGEVEGIVPLVLEGRTARFAGSGLGDRFGPAAPPEGEVEVAAALGRALREIRGSWSSLVLENVAAGADWWQALSRTSGCGSHPIVARSIQLPGIDLDGRSWDEYMATRSRNLRSQIGRRRRALERAHDVQVRWTRKAEQVEPDMTLLFQLHHARWSARAGASSMTSQRALAFHSDFAKVAADRGWLRLAFLEVDGEPVAGWYGWRFSDRFAYYQAGFNPEWADRSVGFVLFAETIRAAAEEGATSYDMLLGEEHFKQRFADHADSVCTVLIAPWWRPARALAGAEAAMRRASRRLPPELRERVKRGASGALGRLPMARRR